jgi:hypothetical protein
MATAIAAFALIAGGALPVIALSTPTRGAASNVAAPTAVALAAPQPAGLAASLVQVAPVASVAWPVLLPPPPSATLSISHPVVVAVPKPAAKPTTHVSKPVVTAPRVVTYKAVTSHTTPPHKTTFTGSNHVWIPTLGVSRPIYTFACSRSREPDNLVYTWGCAGSNNVYLMGHAYGVFKPIYDAYYSGALRKGLNVIYANSHGVVHTYSVVWWKTVRPTTDASWAWADLGAPSMTLQTCVGANSEYRLMVRLVEVN